MRVPYDNFWGNLHKLHEPTPPSPARPARARAMPSLFDIRYAVLPVNDNRHKSSQNISQNAHDYEGDEPAAILYFTSCMNCDCIEY